jgi:hypothetical protein
VFQEFEAPRFQGVDTRSKIYDEGAPILKNYESIKIWYSRTNINFQYMGLKGLSKRGFLTNLLHQVSSVT